MATKKIISDRFSQLHNKLPLTFVWCHCNACTGARRSESLRALPVSTRGPSLQLQQMALRFMNNGTLPDQYRRIEVDWTPPELRDLGARTARRLLDGTAVQQKYSGDSENALQYTAVLSATAGMIFSGTILKRACCVCLSSVATCISHRTEVVVAAENPTTADHLFVPAPREGAKARFCFPPATDIARGNNILLKCLKQLCCSFTPASISSRRT